MDRRVQVPFQDAMKLKGLARGNAQRAIGIASSQFVYGQILVSSQNTARNTRAHHHLIGLIFTNGLACLQALIAILLLVRAMKLEQLDLLFRKTRTILLEFLHNLSTQVATSLFYALNLATRTCAQVKQVVLLVISHLSSLLHILLALPFFQHKNNQNSCKFLCPSSTASLRSFHRGTTVVEPALARAGNETAVSL